MYGDFRYCMPTSFIDEGSLKEESQLWVTSFGMLVASIANANANLFMPNG